MRSDIKIELDQGLGSIELADSLGLSIYYAVQDMNINEMREVSCCLADLYLTPDNVGRFRKIRHERYALVIRTIFGDLSRNGMILSDTHPSRENDIKRNESWVNHNWEKPFEFCDILQQEFESRDNLYGVLLLCEMLAHRYGDLSVVGVDHVVKMEQLYMKSYDLSKKIQCQKQMFSPWYWGAFYFMRLDHKEKSICWFKKYHNLANQYMTDTQPSYRSMFHNSLLSTKKLLPRKEWKEYKHWLFACLTNAQMVRVMKQEWGMK